MSEYVPAALLSDPAVRPPELLDWIEFEFDGVTVRVRGVLHGLTGGANREYVALVERSIAAAQRTGPILAEKSMKAMYRAKIDKELDDWMVFRFRDVFMLGANLYFRPSLLWMLVTAGFKEKLTQHDEFDAGGRSDADLLGGSPLFHRVDPFERRKLAGFPEPVACVERHLALRTGADPGDAGRAIVPGRHWRHLNKIERHSLIPIRSVHMLRFAVAYARKRKVGAVNLFVGEMHNSDMAVIAREWDGLGQLNEAYDGALLDISWTAQRAGSGQMWCVEKAARYIRYIAGLSAPLFLAGAAGVAAFAIASIT